MEIRTPEIHQDGYYKVEKEYYKTEFVEETDDFGNKKLVEKQVLFGRDVKWVPTSTEAIKKQLRTQRNAECFPIINRGKLWYDKLTSEQLIELEIWYKSWLDCTETMIAPIAPSFLKE